MAAFTQRVVSPAETHFTIQHYRALFRAPLQLINTPARSALRFASSGLFCFVFSSILMRRAWLSYHDPSVWIVFARVGEQSASSLSREVPPPQNLGFFSVSRLLGIAIWHLSAVFLVVKLPCIKFTWKELAIKDGYGIS